LEKAGLTADERGVIPTNDHWQTKHSHIYGIGDVVKGAMLAHKAEEEGIAAVEHILGELHQHRHHLMVHHLHHKS
jgi:dihydrolipoamide dehydrogenase